MNYLILKIGDNEIPVMVGEGLDITSVEWPGKIIAGGQMKIQQLMATCQGKLDFDGREIGSRGLPDEILIQHYEYIKALP